MKMKPLHSSKKQRLSVCKALTADFTTGTRALLTQKMVESAARIDTTGERGEYQPLSYWELKGYDVDRIKALAKHKLHPILGDTYKIDISHEDTEFQRKLQEERLHNMETAVYERRAAAPKASAAPPAAALSLELPTIMENGKKRKATPEEKLAAQAEAKAARVEAKKRDKLETVAAAAAAKLLPRLKATLEKFDKTMAKVSDLPQSQPTADVEHDAQVREKLAGAVTNGTAMLASASKGKALESLDEKDLLTEKKLQEIAKDANASIRNAQAFIRDNKENAGQKGNKNKGKK